MDELDSPTGLERYNETARWAMVDPNPEISREASMKTSKGKSVIKYGSKGAGLELEVQHNPFKITQRRNGEDEIVINDRSLFHMEHFRRKGEVKAEVEGKEGILGEAEQMVLGGDKLDRGWFEEDDGDMFQEVFRSWTDSKPKGELFFGE